MSSLKHLPVRHAPPTPPPPLGRHQVTPHRGESLIAPLLLQIPLTRGVCGGGALVPPQRAPLPEARRFVGSPAAAR